jgi:hypothetical protein
MPTFADAEKDFLSKHRLDDRAKEWFDRSASINNDRGAFASPAQHDNWSQMRFQCDPIDTREKFDWWKNFISRHSITGGHSASLMDTGYGKCELFICFFEFNDIPCIVVPVYINLGVGLAQGIIKTTRNFDTHSYAGLHTPTPDAMYSSELNTIIPSIDNLGILLLAQVCASMKLDFLFASPIAFFRDMLLLYLGRNNIAHWSARNLHSSSDDVRSEVLEDDELLPCLPAWWTPQRKHPTARCLTLDGSAMKGVYGEHDPWFRYFTTSSGNHTHVPQFNIIDGKWIPNERQLQSDANGDANGDLDDYCETFYPYNFLWMLGGEGMVIVHAPDFAIHAPLSVTSIAH